MVELAGWFLRSIDGDSWVWSVCEDCVGICSDLLQMVYLAELVDFLKGMYARTDDLDACIGATYACTGYLDACIRATYSCTDDLDACVKAMYACTDDLDACVKATYPRTDDLDACVKGSTPAQFT
jgi:hypothetical protein